MRECRGKQMKWMGERREVNHTDARVWIWGAPRLIGARGKHNTYLGLLPPSGWRGRVIHADARGDRAVPFAHGRVTVGCVDRAPREERGE